MMDFIAGCLGGCAGVLVGHPFDTIKVRLQTQDSKKPLYRGTWHCFSSIVKTEAVAGLFKGMSSPMAGLAFINAIVFGVYGNVQRSFNNANSVFSHFVAGFVAGTVQSIVCSPMELAKTRMQLQGQGSTLPVRFGRTVHYISPLDCLLKIYRLEGVHGIFRGLAPTALRDSPAFAVYFSSYEFLTQKALTDDSGHISTFAMMLAGGCAGVISWVTTYPIDMIKSRIQADGMYGVKQYRGIFDCAVKSYRKEGAIVFTKGMGSAVIRAFPTNAATFTVVTWVFKLSDQQKTLDLRTDSQRLLVDSDVATSVIF